MYVFTNHPHDKANSQRFIHAFNYPDSYDEEYRTREYDRLARDIKGDWWFVGIFATLIITTGVMLFFTDNIWSWIINFLLIGVHSVNLWYVLDHLKENKSKQLDIIIEEL